MNLLTKFVAGYKLLFVVLHNMRTIPFNTILRQFALENPLHVKLSQVLNAKSFGLCGSNYILTLPNFSEKFCASKEEFWLCAQFSMKSTIATKTRKL